jgi:hypothetical protein
VSARLAESDALDDGPAAALTLVAHAHTTSVRTFQTVLEDRLKPSECDGGCVPEDVREIRDGRRP